MTIVTRPFPTCPAIDTSVPELVASAKWAYTTRRMDLARATGLLSAPATVPNAGDLVLARVINIGQHERIELQSGRRARLFADDLIAVAYGSRYAPDQFLARTPTDLGPCDLAAAGGLASRVETRHCAMSAATTIEPVGILTDGAGRRLNLREGAITPAAPLSSHRSPTIAVVGSSMNAGKTTTAATLVMGLRTAGLRVGAAKVTGTGAGGDVWLLTDSGADRVYDFTHAGVPSTFGLSPEDVRAIFQTLATQLMADGTDVNVIEVADGLNHAETAALLNDPVFLQHVDGVIFAARDSLGATAGVRWLRAAGIPVLSVSGLLTASPLATEEFRQCADTPVDDTPALRDPGRAAALRDHALATRNQDLAPALRTLNEDEEAV